jgi:alpha-L-fucosidase
LAERWLTVPGLLNDVKNATLLATGKKLQTRKDKDQLVISLPATAPDAMATVIRLDVEGIVEKTLAPHVKNEMQAGEVH